MITLFSSSNSSDDITIQSQNEISSGNNTVSKIKADIEGEVVKPSVCELLLAAEFRIQGLSAAADRN